jgi:hypothetical protein
LESTYFLRFTHLPIPQSTLTDQTQFRLHFFYLT